VAIFFETDFRVPIISAADTLFCVPPFFTHSCFSSNNQFHYNIDMPSKKKPNNSTNEKEENSSTHPTVLPLSLPTGGGTPTLADRKAQQNAEMDALESSNSIAMVPTGGLKSDAEVHARVIAPSTTGLAIAGSTYSLSGGVCHSLGDQSLGTLGDEIDPFFQLDVDSLAIMAIKEELDRLEVEYTSAKKDQLKV